MLVQQVPQTVFMSILRTKMTRRIAINIFGILISACHQDSLYNTKIAANGSYVEWCAEVPTARIDVRTILNEELD